MKGDFTRSTFDKKKHYRRVNMQQGRVQLDDDYTLGTTKSESNSSYPEVITRLPEAEVALEGAKAWIMQGKQNQIVFCEFEAEIGLQEHSHNYAQWGIVIEGKMELKIDGKPRICQKGDEYLIPAQAKHCVNFLSHTRVIDLFSEKARYKPKQTKYPR